MRRGKGKVARGMDHNPSEIEWRSMATEERHENVRLLYSVIQHVAPRHGKKIEQYAVEALGVKTGTALDSVSNIRRGRISAQKAAAMHEFLMQRHYDEARALVPELFPESLDDIWLRFVEEHKVPDRLTIVKTPKGIGIAQRAADVVKPGQVLQFGEEYCLRLDAPFDGRAVAFQGYRGLWYPLALSANGVRKGTAIQAGEQWLPCEKNGEPIRLVEFDDAGDHTFIVAASEGADSLSENRQDLIRQSQVCVFSCNVRFVP